MYKIRKKSRNVLTNVVKSVNLGMKKYEISEEGLGSHFFLAEPDGAHDYVRMSRKGITKSAAYALGKAFSFTIEELAGVLNITARTLQRKADSETMPLHVSERLIELFVLFKMGVEVFGDSTKFLSWLQTPVVSLGGIAPKAFLDTTFGIKIVYDELGRIQHGVFS